jgi:TonB family protein
MVAPKTKKASEQRPAVARTSLPAPTIKEAQSELTELEKSEDVAEEASRAALATQIAPLNTPTIDDSDLPIVNAEPVDEKQIQNDIDGSLEKIETGDVKTASIDDDLNEAIKEKDDSLNQAMAAAQADEDREHAARTAVIQAEKLKAEELRKQELAEQAEVNALAAQKAAQLAAALKAEQAAAALAAQQEAAEKAASAQAFAAAQAAESLAKANQVRALEELKQKPGNKKPLYDNEDRLNQRAGEVSFLALINKAGEPVQFKLVKSTGHKTLDLKTLKAIRNWKFYPGQEGWVEIPFKWDLQGGAQEMPATLRRKVSQN